MANGSERRRLHRRLRGLSHIAPNAGDDPGQRIASALRTRLVVLAKLLSSRSQTLPTKDTSPLRQRARGQNGEGGRALAYATGGGRHLRQAPAASPVQRRPKRLRSSHQSEAAATIHPRNQSHRGTASAAEATVAGVSALAGSRSPKAASARVASPRSAALADTSDPAGRTKNAIAGSSPRSR